MSAKKRAKCVEAHPDHGAAVPRLHKIQGQLSGIESMIDDRRYCVDILIQLRAALAALRSLEASVFSTHLRHCVKEAMRSRDPAVAESKVEELMGLLSGRNRR